MCPDQGSNPQPFSYKTILQPTEPHWSGQPTSCLKAPQTFKRWKSKEASEELIRCLVSVRPRPPAHARFTDSHLPPLPPLQDLAFEPALDPHLEGIAHLLPGWVACHINIFWKQSHFLVSFDVILKYSKDPRAEQMHFCPCSSATLLCCLLTSSFFKHRSTVFLLFQSTHRIVSPSARNA